MSSTKTYVVTLAPLFVCEACWKPIRHGAGYLCVDREAATQLMGTGGRINWHIFHAECDESPSAADHLIWTRKFQNTNDLFETMADLSERMLWFQATNWQGLVRRIIADTNRYGEQRCVKRHDDPDLREARRKEYLAKMLVNPDDHRHGTVAGYSSIGCRCDRCREASTEGARSRRIKKNGHNGQS